MGPNFDLWTLIPLRGVQLTLHTTLLLQNEIPLPGPTEGSYCNKEHCYLCRRLSPLTITGKALLPFTRVHLSTASIHNPLVLRTSAMEFYIGVGRRS